MILLDQSGSMDDDEKANYAATAVNRVIYEIGQASTHGEKIKDRCFVGVVGYGESVQPVVGGMISQVAAKPIRIERVDRKVSDGAGGLVDAKMEMPIWVEPKAANGTPMADAMREAIRLIKGWVKKNPDSFPPVVINITDGMPSDYDEHTGNAPQTRMAANELLKLKTSDGSLLLFNAHITGAASPSMEIKLPHTDDTIHDPYAKLLFSISSVLPSRLMDAARQVGFTPHDGARGMVFNAGIETLIKLITFGSSTSR
jgi:hypothetical protein